MIRAIKYTFCHPIEVAQYFAMLDRERRERAARRVARKLHKKKPVVRIERGEPLSADELDAFAVELRAMVCP
jgi:hypothetical protein